MNERKYWRTFYNSGRIEDYLSYKGSSLVTETSDGEKAQLGAVDVERFCACDRHGTENKQSG